MVERLISVQPEFFYHREIKAGIDIFDILPQGEAHAEAHHNTDQNSTSCSLHFEDSKKYSP